MKFLTTIIGILPVLCAVAPCSAALRAGGGTTATSNPDGRISITPSIGVTSASNLAAARRLPTLKVPGATTNINVSSGSSSGSSDSALMDEVECVERYTECIKASDVCDFNFEECTTKELFYAKKPQCNSVLLQCSSAGINTLFGTSDLTQLSVTNADLYPSAGSIVGQFIDAGAISNRLDTSSCVKRYTSCLKKDNVCGEDFELCTTNSEFKKQKIYCESTLARCQEEGIKELFGLTDTSRDPTSQSRLGVMITEGAGLAAVNAVSTCYKVANQCFLAACSENPYRCMINSSMQLVNATDKLNQNDEGGSAAEQSSDVVNASLVRRYLRGACFDTIGSNKYCHMTVSGEIPSSKDLLDEQEREEVYSDIYTSVMNTTLRERIQKIANAFDTKAKRKCSDTIKECAQRSCGGGLGSACYSYVFGSNRECFGESTYNIITGDTAPVDGDAQGNTIETTLPSDILCSINGDSTYLEIRNGCEAIVNTDQNCLYSMASVKKDTYGYTFSNSDAFTTLFPKMETHSDPIGVVKRLNASLRDNYNPAAIERMGKDCKNTAVSCIRSMCGADFVNCYRNRTDVMSDAYNTDNADFNKSMNKVTGVLDFNIVRGLCVNMVKGSDKCDEHLKIQTYRMYADGNGKTGWGNKKTVRDAWVDASKDGYNKTDSADTRILMGCMVKKSNTASGGLMGRGGESICDSKAGNPNYIEDCGTVDEEGCLYDEEYYVTETDYQYSMTVDTMFQEILADLELEAQAKYNAKLTAEQHMCIDANSGGIMGNREGASTYMWVKLRSKRIPKNYSTAGLKVNDFTESNDLYGSFCRARVTIQSDDPDIQTILQSKNNNWSTAYFAVGDVFTCGSWIPQKELEKIANRVACKKAKAEGKIDHKFDCNNATDDTIDSLKLTVGQQWAVAASALGGAGIGTAAFDLLQTKTGVGGLLNTTNGTSSTQNQLVASYTNATNMYNAHCTDRKNKSENCNKDGATNEEDNACFTSSSSFVANKYMVQTFTWEPGGGGSVKCGQLAEYIGKVKGWLDVDDSTDSVNRVGWGKIGRAMVDLTGATAGGVVGGIGVSNALKASNRQKFTEDEQAFMREIGEHIYCFIGADEAGTYGDLIEISVE